LFEEDIVSAAVGDRLDLDVTEMFCVRRNGCGAVTAPGSYPVERLSLEAQDQHCSNRDLQELRESNYLREIQMIVDVMITARTVTDGAKAQPADTTILVIDQV
jgi:hypothetical protein